MLPPFLRHKSKNDLLLWYATIGKLSRYTVFGSVVFNPRFFINDINVNNAAVYTHSTIPSCIYKLIVA